MEHSNKVYAFPKAYFCHRSGNLETLIKARPIVCWTYYGSLPSGYVYSKAGSDYATAGGDSVFFEYLRMHNNTKIPLFDCLYFYCPMTSQYPDGYDATSPYMTALMDNMDELVNVNLCYGLFGSTGYRLYFDPNDKSFWMDVSFQQLTNNAGGVYYNVQFKLAGDRVNFNVGASAYAGCRSFMYRSDFGLGQRYQAQMYVCGIPFFGSYLGNQGNDVFSDDFASLNFYTTNWASVLERESIVNSWSWNYLNGYGGSWWGVAANYQNVWIGDYEPVEPDFDNAYWEGGTSDEGGGGGNFSDDSDDVIVDPLPDLDAVGTGFATLFTPTKGQLHALADVMWDSNVFTALQNLVENITDMFTSLSIVPFTVTAGSTVTVNWLGLPITGIDLTLALEQFYTFDMGSINLANDNRIFTSGSALDYSPFSKLGIFLPFIGFQDLDIDECRDATIGLKYRIDILSGTCVALISINGNTIYQFTGNCLSQIPITNESMQSLVTDAVNVGIAATASHSAAGAASADMTAAKSETDAAVRDAKMAHAQAHVSSSRGHLASATANAAMGLKPTFGKAGSISSSASLLAVKQPYLFLTTPRQSIPDHYQRYCGFPSNISDKLSKFKGFTVVEDIRLNGLVATSPEVSEIYQLLKSGVII